MKARALLMGMALVATMAGCAGSRAQLQHEPRKRSTATECQGAARQSWRLHAEKKRFQHEHALRASTMEPAKGPYAKYAGRRVKE